MTDSYAIGFAVLNKICTLNLPVTSPPTVGPHMSPTIYHGHRSGHWWAVTGSTVAPYVLRWIVPRVTRITNFAKFFRNSCRLCFFTRILQVCKRIAVFARLVHSTTLQDSCKSFEKIASFIQKFLLENCVVYAFFVTF